MSNIAIIGAGYTGLTAALRLAQAGHKVTIYENSPNVGGLASDFKIEGTSIERAYHHIFKTDTDIINLAKELGIESEIEWHDSSVALYYNNKIYPFKGALDLIKFSPLSLFNRLKAGLVVLRLQKMENWQSLENVTAYEWMLKNAGHQVTEVIWEPLLRGKFDKFYNKVSMAWLWARVHIRAQSREASGEKLGYFRGGFQTFTNTLVHNLEKLDVKIITNSSVKSIDSSPNGKVNIELADGHIETFDKCIATVPSHVFAKISEKSDSITKDYSEKLNSIDYLEARIMVFSSDQEISKYYWHNINDISKPFLVFINHTKLIKPENYNGKHIYYIATYVPHDHRLFNISDEELKNEWFANLKEIFPNFSPEMINEEHFFRLANAQHIVTTNYRSKIPDNETPIKSVYLANFSQIYPEDRGTNYAVREGIAIADKIK